MANIKFSDFTANGNIDGGSVPSPSGSETSFLVGFDSTAPTNNKWTLDQVAAGLPTFYAGNGSINEDRTITIGHDSSSKASYTITFDSNKSTNTSTRNTALGNRLILTETVTSAPTGYSSSRGAGISLTHNSSGDDVTGTINVQSVNSGSSDYYGRSQMGFRTNTGFVFAQTAGWAGDALIVRDSLASNQSKSLRYHTSQSDGGRLRLCAPNAKTSQILLATDISNTFYRYISGANNGALTLGRKLSSGSEEAYITCTGIGGAASAAIAVGINQSTPTETLHVTGNAIIDGQAYSAIETSVAVDSINWNNSNVQEVTLVSGATTDFDATNFKAGATYILKLIQPAGGNALVGWEAAGAVVNWSGGTPPTLSTAAAAEDIVTLICTSAAGNGTYYANATLNFS